MKKGHSKSSNNLFAKGFKRLKFILSKINKATVEQVNLLY